MFRLPAALLLFALTIALAGCGGSDNGETSSAAATTAQAASTPLSEEDWAKYTAIRAEARSVNTAATKTFTKCRVLAAPSSNADPDKVKACLGDSTTKVVDTGRKTQSALAEATTDAQGACATAATNLQGAITLYIASVNALGTAVDAGNLPSASNSMASSQEGLTNARSSATAFEQACKPS